MKIFGDQVLQTPPELNRAQCTLIPKPWQGDKTRPMIMFHRHQTKELACKWRNDLKYRVSVGLRSRMRELVYPFIYFQRSREKRPAEGQGGEVNAAEASSLNGWVVTDSQRRLCSLSRWVVADDHRSELQGSWVLFQERQKQSRDTRKQQLEYEEANNNKREKSWVTTIADGLAMSRRLRWPADFHSQNHRRVMQVWKQASTKKTYQNSRHSLRTWHIYHRFLSSFCFFLVSSFVLHLSNSLKSFKETLHTMARYAMFSANSPLIFTLLVRNLFYVLFTYVKVPVQFRWHFELDSQTL